VSNCVIDSSSSLDDDDVNNSINTYKLLITTDSPKARFCTHLLTVIGIVDNRRIQNRVPELPTLPLH